jgi:hypothetical protein
MPFSKLFAEKNLKKRFPVLDEYHPGVCSVNMTNLFQTRWRPK